MGLVYGDQGQVHLVEQRERPLAEQAFRRRVEEVEFAAADPVLDLQDLGIGEGGVQAGGPDPLLPERGHLVVHERDERRNDNPQPRAHERRDLVAQRLPAPGGHEHQRVPAGEHLPDHRLLVAEEPVEPEDPAQDLPGARDSFGFHRLVRLAASLGAPGFPRRGGRRRPLRAPARFSPHLRRKS